MNPSIISPSIQAGQDPNPNPLVFILVDRLKLHPHNMRLYYPPQDITKMAASIRAHNGVYQALLVVEDEAEPGTYFVVDGNMRLAGGRHLGADCPSLKCEIIEAGRAEQLLAMSITTEFHFPKDVVSQGQHYRRLMDQEKLTILDIAQSTGVSRPTIEKALKTLELEPEIQQLIITASLSGDLRVTRALLDLPDSATRLRLARRFARNETSIRGIIQGCRFVARQAAALAGQDALQQLEQAQSKRQQIVAKVQVTKTAIAQSARPSRLDPATAELLQRVAGQTLCDDCLINGLTEQCYLCPGPRDFINALIELVEPSSESVVANSNGNGHLAAEKKRLAQLGAQLRADLTGRRAA